MKFRFLLAACSFLGLPAVFAGSATWSTRPTSVDWNTPTNWNPATVPNGPADIATFGVSARATPSLTSSIEADSILFSPGASAYTISLQPGNPGVNLLTLSGAGVVNDSGQTQNFALNPKATNHSEIDFTNGATAGNDVVFTAHANTTGDPAGVFQFFGNSDAGTATFINESGSTGGGAQFLFHDSSTAAAGTFFLNYSGGPAICTFLDQTSAGTATFQMDRAELTFAVSSTAAQSFITLSGDNSINLLFGGTATAGEATIVGQGSLLTTIGGAVTYFGFGTATAGTATFRMEGSPVAGIDGPNVQFVDATTAADATFTLEGGTISGGGGGSARFFGVANTGQTQGSSAGNAVLTAEGAQVAGAGGGYILFISEGTIGFSSSAANATLIATPGTNGGAGGGIIFQGTPSGGNARIEVFGNATMDLSQETPALLTTGSLEGDGAVFLGSRNLALGSNNLSTTFAGVLQDGGIDSGTGGALTKLGTGTLTLTGANTYNGGTAVTAGTLAVANGSGSGTGNGAVTATTATLGGKGTVAGTVVLKTGSILAPALGTAKQATFTIRSLLTFQAGSTYKCTFKAKGNKVRADKVLAKGVTIASGATLDFTGQAQGRLQTGLTLTLLSNTSANPISGTFSNLADGALLTIGNNKFQANYEGGDGNDLTLAVVP